MEDTCKIIIDYNEKKGEEKEKVDTGLWTRIHKAQKIQENTVPVGFNLVCEGVKIKPKYDS